MAHIPIGDDRLATAINPATTIAVTMATLVAIWEFFTLAGVVDEVVNVVCCSITVSFPTMI